MNVYEVIRRPLITEKGHAKREAENTLCFELHPEGQSSRGTDQQLCRKAAPPWPVYRLCVGLEKGIRPLASGAESA